LDAQEDASGTVKRALGRREEEGDYEGSSEAGAYLEEAFIDVLDILEGASSDVRDLLGDIAEERGKRGA
jgi:hypothetical protein